MPLEYKQAQGRQLPGAKGKVVSQSSLHLSSGSRFLGIVVDVQVKIGRTGTVVRVCYFQFNSGVVGDGGVGIVFSVALLSLRAVVKQDLDCGAFECTMAVVLTYPLLES